MQQSSLKRGSAWGNHTTTSMAASLTNTLCKERGDDGKSLPCYHVFCRQCGDDIPSASAAPSALSALCPSCRDDTLDDSPIALNCLQFLLPRDEEYENGGGTKSSSAPTLKFCRTCGNDTRAVAWCRQCDDGLCHDCVSQGNRRTPGHCLDKIGEIPSFGTPWQPFAITPPRDEIYCEDHAEEPADFYCEICRQAICSVCRYRAHATHNVSYMKEALSKSRNQSSRILDNTKTELKEVEDCLLMLERIQENVDTRCKAIRQEIISVSTKLKIYVEDRERELLKNLDKIRTLKVQFLHLQREDVKEIHLSLLKKHELLKSTFESAKNLEVFNIRDQLIAFAQELNKSKKLPQPTEDDTIIFSPPNGNVLSIIQTVGNLSSSAFGPNCVAYGSGLKRALVMKNANFIVETKDHLGEPRKTGGEEPIVVVQSVTKGTMIHADVVDRRNGTYAVTFKPHANGNVEVEFTLT